MKHVIIYDNYDFLGMQAAKHGMTREEWMAAYGSGQQGVEESNHVMTYEKYMSYNDLGKWGKYSTESEVEDDLRMKIIRLFQYGAISNHLDDVEYIDQSSDKGIKWQIEIKGKGTDIIHAYKTNKYKGSYEFYLNKKKSSEYDIQQYFLNKYVSELDQYIASMDSFDRHYQMSDDHSIYLAGNKQAKKLTDMYKNLSKSDQKKALKAYNKRFKDSKDLSSFYGI